MTFETMADMARTLTPSRFELLRTLQAQGPMTLRALARLLKRDVKSVHRDVTPLKELDWSRTTRTGSRFRTTRSGLNSQCGEKRLDTAAELRVSGNAECS